MLLLAEVVSSKINFLAELINRRRKQILFIIVDEVLLEEKKSENMKLVLPTKWFG